VVKWQITWCQVTLSRIIHHKGHKDHEEDKLQPFLRRANIVLFAYLAYLLSLSSFVTFVLFVVNNLGQACARRLTRILANPATGQFS
jgi:hypothetical protein